MMRWLIEDFYHKRHQRLNYKHYSKYTVVLHNLCTTNSTYNSVHFMASSLSNHSTHYTSIWMHFVFNAQHCLVSKNNITQICSFISNLEQHFPNEQKYSFRTRNKNTLFQEIICWRLYSVTKSIIVFHHRGTMPWLEKLGHYLEKGFISLFLIFVKFLVSFYNTFLGFLSGDKNVIRYF